jgi:PDZ domain-containing secreted protein
MRHSRWLVAFGRILAVAGALGLGSAMARADDNDNDPDRGRSAQEQKDDSDDDSNRNNDRNARRDDRDDDSSTRSSRSSRDDRDDSDSDRDTRSSRTSRDEDRDFREGGQQGLPRSSRQSQNNNSNNRQGRNFDDEQWSQDQRGGQQHEVGAKFYTDDDNRLTVASVERSGIASRAGLHEDDVIVSVDGRRFRNEDDLHHYLNNVGARQVPVIIERDGHRYTVTLNQMRQQQNWNQQGHQQNWAQNQQHDHSADTAWLGVYLDDNENGAVITQVYPQGPAARAGLRAGDVIVQIDGEDINDSNELVQKIEEKDANTRARFTVLRNEREFPITATLVSRNQFAQSRQGQQNQGQYTQGQNQFQNQNPRGFYDHEQYTEFDQNRHQRSGQQNQNQQWTRTGQGNQQTDRGYQTFSSNGQGNQQGYRTADRTAELERQIEELRQEVRQLRQSVERR